MASTPSQFNSQALPPSVLAPPKPMARRAPATPREEAREADLCARAGELAASWERALERDAADADAALRKRWKAAEHSLEELLRSRSEPEESIQGRRAKEREILLRLALRDSGKAIAERGGTHYVRKPNGALMPRALDALTAYFRMVNYDAGEETLMEFLAAAQQDWPLEIAEFWMLPAFAQLALVEAALAIWRAALFTRGVPAPRRELHELDGVVGCLRFCMEFDWKSLLDTISVTEAILREDPAGAYAQMETESRDQYRQVIAGLARRSCWSEPQIARAAIELAQAPQPGLPERARQRRSHVGFYLVEEGRAELWRAIGYRATVSMKAREAILRKPAFFYFLLLATIGAPVLAVIARACGGGLLRIACVALAVPLVLECAVGVANLLATLLVEPRRLPRLDFSKRIPREHAAVVVVPILLADAAQVRQAVRDLEVRYLANRDANLHFALLTDLPDSVEAAEEKNELVLLCAELIEELNGRYAGQPSGGFFLFHRNRVFNPVEKVWMGWERKRGKLLDFNNLLLGKKDKFPVKVGELARLAATKYVITLDLDTQLPRDSARALIATMAHPLNRAVIDAAAHRVVEGYGILQPRVGINVKSKTKSRLAALFSGDTGFDVYTRAVSDVYQDVFGAAIFAGKGIYEMETFQAVLEHRFPSNAILSHDLIEGEYARTALASDIEVIDDYPTHVAAYSRRKHRWVRGDWQIIFWLLPRVPNYFGRIVRNPLTMVSRWKIVDNLRRSLGEAATFVLLVLGWTVLPVRPWPWTLGILTLLSLPTSSQSMLSVLRGGRALGSATFWKNAAVDMGQSYARLLFRLSLLCHQSLVMLDAVLRAVIRMSVTHKRLLQWETAAQAEGGRMVLDPVQSYLNWQPYLAALIGLVVIAARPGAIAAALPFLLLWGFSKNICAWINRPSHSGSRVLKAKDEQTLRQQALLTWRFFREFGGADENWLVPDLVQESPARTAHRISPTNLGMLLEARLAAHDLGFLTLPELASLTEGTLQTTQRLPKYRGHLFNWYDNHSLEPIGQRFISSVDSGNLVACLWVLKQGCLEAPGRSLFPETLRKALGEHLELLESEFGKNAATKDLAEAIREARAQAAAFASSGDCLALESLGAEVRCLAARVRPAELSADAQWWWEEFAERVQRIGDAVHDFAPWFSSEFAGICGQLGIEHRFLPAELTLETLPAAQAALREGLRKLLVSEDSSQDTRRAAGFLLLSLLVRSAGRVLDLRKQLSQLAADADRLAQQTDFSFLYDAEEELLSIGFDEATESGTAHCYDLLASEARTATFVAVAKGEAPQKSWFRLARHVAACRKRSALLSWSGTMFEYLLPALWMKPYPQTLLGQSARAAVEAQQDFGAERAIPWGISESSCAERTPNGDYHYRAFGVPALAINAEHTRRLVVSPYSTFLALVLDKDSAIANLRRMEEAGLLGSYGFYDACDFGTDTGETTGRGEIVRCWMAHHQGMSLAAAANALCDSPMPRRFHAEPMVAATERLLHEKCPRAVAADLPRLALAPQHLLKGKLPATTVEKLGASA